MYFNFEENKRNLQNPTHVIFMLPIRLSDYRAVGLAIGSLRLLIFDIITH